MRQLSRNSLVWLTGTGFSEYLGFSAKAGEGFEYDDFSDRSVLSGGLVTIDESAGVF